MAKQSKTTNYSNSFKDIDYEIHFLLDDCKNGKAVEELNTEKREKLFKRLHNLIEENKSQKLSDRNITILKSCIDLSWNILSSNSVNLEIKKELFNIVKALNFDNLIEENFLKNVLLKINEYWLVKVELDVPNMEYLTLKHLLNVCSSENASVSDFQKLNAIRKSITATPFDKMIPSLRPLLIKLVQQPKALNLEHGLRFISQALILSNKIMLEIHKTIMLDLSSCAKKKATQYGKIYVMAWHVASTEMKQTLAKNCFQHLMESAFKEQRTSLELNKNSQNTLAVLEVWHLERKTKNPDFITMITNAYQPILWKYLKSGFNVHRCNATDVFFKAFPLQRSNDNAADAEKLFDLQFDVMLESLSDDCHIVRIIAIREVCNILSLYWNSFKPFQIQKLMSVITKKNANDASSADVRRMVYLGLQSLVKSPLSCEYVKQILPNLADNIHDVNQRVRIAFIQLLICIKDKKDPNFKYTDVVTMFNIQYRLAEDNIAVGQWIVKLLIKNYYHSKMSVVEWTKRFIYLIKNYRNSYRNFFFFSLKSLPFLDACTIIYEILTQLGIFVMSRLELEQENNEYIMERPKEKKKGNKKIPLSDWNKSKNSMDVENNESKKKCAFDDAEVVAGLFDIVTILWVIHNIKLNEPENEEIKFRLYDTYIKYAQPFISYYKDCDLFLNVLSLSGNIPSSLLRINNITLPGYCIKMLKSMKINGSNEDNEKVASMLIALVKWGKGSEILEQVTLWLEATFETQNMNETILPRRKVKINEIIKPNSIVAINILDSLLKKEYVRLSIFKNSYDQLFGLWKFMSKIRMLIEARLEVGVPFSEDLVSDEFVVLCFRRYVKLIPLLKGEIKHEEEKENESKISINETFVNHQKEMENLIEWAENSLFSHLQAEEVEENNLDLVIAILEDILYVSDNMIIIHLVNSLFCFKISHFMLKLLATKYGASFIKSASRITVALNYSTKLLFKVKDDLQIFSTVIPSLLSHTLNVLTNRELSSKDTKKILDDMPVIKMSFSKVLLTFENNLKSTTSLKENARRLKLVVSFFVDCIVTLVAQEILSENSSLPLYLLPSQLPPIAGSLLNLFHNKKTWTPLFLHVINSKFATKSYDVKSTISAILLLHLFSVSDKKVNQEDLKKGLTCAFKCLTEFKDLKSKTENWTERLTDTEKKTKKSWSSSAATRGDMSTQTRLTSSNTEKNILNEDEKDEDNTQPTVLQSIDLSSFHCEGNTLEEDLISCGFELIKKTEDNICQRTEKADVS